MRQNLTTVRKRFNEIREEAEKKSVETDKLKVTSSIQNHN